jgi:hypothetical protein
MPTAITRHPTTASRARSLAYEGLPAKGRSTHAYTVEEEEKGEDVDSILEGFGEDGEI